MQLVFYCLFLLCNYALGTEAHSRVNSSQLNVYKMPENPEDERDSYENFKKQYKKIYVGDEDEKRFHIFRENLEKAKAYQEAELGTATYGVTRFFDISTDEFRKQYLTARKPHNDDSTERIHVELDEQLPPSIDWREYGAVGPVFNQGTCGSCWASSAVQNIEGQWFMKTRRLMQLSVQQVLDCDYHDAGCNGGCPLKAYKAIKRIGGLELAHDYPYCEHQQQCLVNPQLFVAYVNGSVELPKNSDKIANYLARYGPLSALLNLAPLQYYTSGVLKLPASYCDPNDLNHAVLSVGYGTDGGLPYWIVKNTWGPNWGEQGYFRLYRGDNTCGINEQVTSATIALSAA